jgi:phosphatidylglycerophosphate synthase
MLSEAPPPSKENQTHTRVVDTLLTRAERKLLLWFAARMPAWVTPDTLTAFGFLGSIVICLSYALTARNPLFLWVASLGFVINWFGDSLDGTLARYRTIERPRYGFFIDHMIDSINEVLIFIGLGLSPYLRFDLALIALVSYLLASIYVYLTTYVNGIFRLSYSGISPTEMRLIAIVTNAVVFFTGNLTFSLPATSFDFIPATLTLFDLVVVGVILIISYLVLANTVITASQLSCEDREAARIKRQQERALRQQERALRASARQAGREERQQRKVSARQARMRSASPDDHTPRAG